MSDICVAAKILNPRIRPGGYCGLKFLRALISNIMIQTLDFIDRLYLKLFLFLHALFGFFIDFMYFWLKINQNNDYNLIIILKTTKF